METLDTLVHMAPERIVYVSCDPATLARDVKILQEKGYVAQKVAVVDQFCHSGHAETVVCLSQQKPDDVIEVEIELDELDLTFAESKATYKEIQEYVLKEHGLKVSNLYISQVKRKCGIEVGENYNLPKSEESRQPQCPVEKYGVQVMGDIAIAIRFDPETWEFGAEGKRLRCEAYARRFMKQYLRVA